MLEDQPQTTTSHHLNLYLEKTPIPTEMSARSASPGISAQSSFIHPDESLHMASTPNINLLVHDAGHHDNTKSFGGDQNSNPDNHDLSYKSKLRYVPSKSFVGETTSINEQEGASAPNTFKHKSHPNAKTKSHIMLSSVEERLSTMLDAESSKALLHRDNDSSIHHSSTDPVKDIFPSCLDQSWQEPSSLGHNSALNDLQAQLDQIGLASGAETLIHKKSHDKPIPTADWKKAQKESKRSQVNQPLHHVFNANHQLKSDSSHTQNKDELNFTSEASSEFLDQSSFDSSSERGRNSEEDLYKNKKDKFDGHENRTQSPLKLYKTTYDTFTKGFLGNALKGFNPCLPRNIQQELKSEEIDSKERNPEAAFYNNAENIFKKLKNNKAFQTDVSPGRLTINEERALPVSSIHKSNMNSEHVDGNDYTSISGNTSGYNSASLSNEGKYLLSSSYLQNFNSDHQEYTCDQTSQAVASETDSDRSSDTIQHNASRFKFTSTNPEEYTADDTEQISDSNASFTTDSYQNSNGIHNVLSWKNTDELRRFLSIGNLPKGGAALKGTVKPGQFTNWKAPTVLGAGDRERAQGDKENQDEDFFTQEARSPGILKGADHMNKSRAVEVTFVDEFSSSDITADFDAPDVTRISVLDDISFSQSDKYITSLITGATDDTDWKSMKYIDLSNRGVQHITGLEKSLPVLQRANFAHNNIRHLEGLSRTLNELDISHNDLNELTSFLPVPELLFLSAHSNNIDSFSCLAQNITLTRLDLGNNRLKDLAGLEHLSNLVTLKLDLNLLHGVLDFSKYDLPHLQELRLNNNRITSIEGLDGLKKLAILDLANNCLSEFSCIGRLPNLKKLILSSNQLKTLSVESFPSLRVLRIDGNEFDKVEGLEKLLHLWEVSAMFQKQERVTQAFCKNVTDVSRLNLSGNGAFFRNFYREVCLESFYNVNVLKLQAVNLKKISNVFVETFPNVRHLNLNFNDILDILGLANLCSLKELYLVQNNVRQIEPFLSSLVQSRGTLEVLDLKMNPCTMDFYPDILKKLKKDIQMDDFFSPGVATKVQIDDMESFANISKVMEESKSGWKEQDLKYNLSLRSQNDQNYNHKRRYETIMIEFFYALQELDGLLILEKKCKEARKDLQSALRKFSKDK